MKQIKRVQKKRKGLFLLNSHICTPGVMFPCFSEKVELPLTL